MKVESKSDKYIPGFIQILTLVDKARPALKESGVVDESIYDTRRLVSAELKRIRKQQKALACLKR